MRKNIYMTVGAGFLFMLAVCILGNMFYHAQRHQLKREAEKDLETIAEFKIKQIVEWRLERFGNAWRIKDDKVFQELMSDWRKHRRQSDKEKILSRFDSVRRHYRYDDVSLIDTNGNVLLSLEKRGKLRSKEMLAAVKKAIETDTPQMSDLHINPVTRNPHLDMVAPLQSMNGVPPGAVILHVEADRFLFSLIASWPVSSHTAETLIVQRKGGSVLFMNNLRHRKNAALKLTIPLNSEDVPAVMAVKGRNGIVEGKDYRGHEVLSYIKHIPDSPWYMVAKEDKSEALSVWTSRSMLIVLLMLAIFVGTVAFVSVSWQRAKTSHFRDLYNSEAALRESEESYRTVLMSIGDGVITTDAAGKVKLLNNIAENLSGWTQEQAEGKTLEEIFDIVNEDTRHPAANPVDRVFKEGVIVGLANHTMLISRDGSEHPIADSAAPVRDEKGNIIGSVLVFRDQTEEREKQKALAESEAWLRESQRIANLGHYFLDIPSGTWTNSPALDELFGIGVDYPRTVESWARIMHPDHRDEMVKYLTEHVIGERNPFDKEYKIIKIDSGEERWVRGLGELKLDEQGNPVKMFGTIQDITELKRAQQDYEMLFQEMLDGFALHEIILDEKGEPVNYKFLAVNPAFEKLTGMRWDMLAGKTVLEAFPETEKYWIETYGRVALTGEPAMFENHHAGLDRHFEVTAFRPAPMRFACIFSDITEKKRSQEVLQARLRILDHSTKCSLDDLLLKTLDEIEKLTGSCIGFFHFVDDDQKNLHLKTWSTNTINNMCTAKGKDSHYGIDKAGVWVDCVHEMRPVIHNDYASLPHRKGLPPGHAPVIRELVVPVLHEDKVTAILGVGNKATDYNEKDIETALLLANLAYDIIHRKRAEEALQKSEMRLRTISDNLPECMIYQIHLDNEGVRRFTYVSDAVSRLHGCTPEEAMADAGRIYGTVLEEDMEKVASKEETAIAEFRDFSAEARIRKTDGEIRWSSFASRPRRLEDSSILWDGIEIDITERKNAEEALRESEEKFRELFETMTEGVVYQNREGNIFSANPSAERILGITRDKMLLRTSESSEWKAVKEDGSDFPGEEHPSSVALSTGKEIRNVTMGVFVPTLGEYRWLNINAVPQFLEGEDSPAYVYSTFSDITERKRAEEYRTQFWNILEKSLNEIYIFESKSLKFKHVNTGALRNLGYTLEEIKKLTPYDIKPEIDENSFRRMIDPLLKQEREIIVFETVHKRKDGSLYDVEVHLQLFPLDTEEMFLALIIDTTERKKAEKALRESEEKFSKVYSNSALPQILNELDTGIYVEANEAALGFVGYSREELIGSTGAKLGIFESGAREALVERAVKEGDVKEVEVCLTAKNGEKKYGLYSATVIEYGGHRLLHSSIADITARKAAEEELGFYRDRLEELVKERTAQLEEAHRQLTAAEHLALIGQFSGSIAHEIRNPLATIGSSIYMLQTKTNDVPEVKKYVDIIKGEIARCADIIESIQRIGRMEKPSLKQHSSSACVERTLSTVTIPPNIEVTISKGPDPIVPVDVEQVRIAFKNIVTNAVQSMPEGGKLSISIGQKDGFAVFSFSDTGTGIPEDHKDKIFMPLFSTKTFGIGFGLSIVKMIIDHHEGKIEVSDNRPAGAVFTISLPLAR